MAFKGEFKKLNAHGGVARFWEFCVDNLENEVR